MKKDTPVGLSQKEVQERIDKGLVNTGGEARTKSTAQIFRTNLITYFNLLFVALAVILFCFIDGGAAKFGNFGFLFVVGFNSCIGLVQEIKAKRTLDKMTVLAETEVTVLRDSAEKKIPYRDLVQDDIVLLAAGDQIMADAVMIDGGLEVNESLLTGEADAVEKAAGAEVLSGSFVTAGKGLARVVHVGKESFAAKIARSAKVPKASPSRIMRTLQTILRVMSLVIVPIGIALFLVKYLAHGGILEKSVVTTVGSLVGMIPSGLVALTSTVFCVSVVKLARHKTLAKTLTVCESLAHVDVICFDKTGTLTEGRLQVEEIILANHKPPLDDIKRKLAEFFLATGDENATAAAVKAYAGAYPKERSAVRILPFSSARRYSGVVFSAETLLLGSPECFPLTKALSDKIHEKTSAGFRALVFGGMPSPSNSAANDKLPPAKQPLPNLDKFSPIAVIILSDKIRPEAPETCRFFAEEGVAVKVISGDNLSTVVTVARRIGLAGWDKAIDMSAFNNELRNANDEYLSSPEELYDHLVAAYTVFARVLPEQKRLLVAALKRQGHTVAMTGDGVNDVPALRLSDCAVVPAKSAAAAKCVSDLVLMDNNFSSIPRTVLEGRRCINNLERSAALFLSKTIYSVLIAVLFLFVQSALPYEPRQLTLIGSLTIGIPAFLLALEPNHARVRGSFLKKTLAASVPGGVAVFLGVAGVLIATKCFALRLSDQQITMLYFLISITLGFCNLIFIGGKPTPLRIGVIAGLILLFLLIYLIPWDTVHAWFGIYNDSLPPDARTVLFGTAACVLPLFATLCIILQSKIRSKK